MRTFFLGVVVLGVMALACSPRERQQSAYAIDQTREFLSAMQGQFSAADDSLLLLSQSGHEHQLILVFSESHVFDRVGPQATRRPCSIAVPGIFKAFQAIYESGSSSPNRYVLLWKPQRSEVRYGGRVVSEAERSECLRLSQQFKENTLLSLTVNSFNSQSIDLGEFGVFERSPVVDP